MRTGPRRSSPARRLAIALWLALLLPLAQLAVAMHAVSHVEAAERSAPEPGKQEAGLAHCHVCVAGAALAHGAAPTAWASGLDVAAPVRPALAEAPRPAAAVVVLAYRSRAPPLLLS